MTGIVVGYVPRPEGQAALARGIAEARLRETRLVVVNATRGDALVDDRFVQGTARDELAAELASAPVPTELRQLDDGRDIALQLESVALETGADLIVIGLRRRSRGRQAHPRQCRQPDPAQRQRPRSGGQGRRVDIR